MDSVWELIGVKGEDNPEMCLTPEYSFLFVRTFPPIGGNKVKLVIDYGLNPLPI